MNNYREDNELMNVLQYASNNDVGLLIDIITDNGKGRMSLDDEVMKSLISAKNHVPYPSKLIIAAEIQKFGGNSLVSIFRGGRGVLYKEIACDVASHVGANFNDNQDVAQIESSILLKIIEKSLDKMSEDEKKEFFDQFGVTYAGIGPVAMAAMIGVVRVSGFASYKMATIVAQATAKALLGKGLTFAATGGLMRGISVFTGPIGWAITGIWTAFDLASPAYRITVPCVIQLAYMRQKALIRECPSCGAIVANDMKYCSECGQKMSSVLLLN
jgi:uncharacterized protein YaaW (UPF0174 family)